MGGKGSGKGFKYNAEDLQKKIDEYFEICNNRTKDIVTRNGDIVTIRSQAPYTIAGLAYHLGIETDTLLNYQKNEVLAPIVDRAKQLCMVDNERRLNEDFTPGVALVAKNYHRFKDQQEIKQEIETTITIKMPEDLE